MFSRREKRRRDERPKREANASLRDRREVEVVCARLRRIRTNKPLVFPLSMWVALDRQLLSFSFCRLFFPLQISAVLVEISSSHRSRLNVRLGAAETSPRSFSILSYVPVHSRVHRLLYRPSFSDITDVQAATNAPRRALQRNICSENLRIDEKTFEGHPARYWHVQLRPAPECRALVVGKSLY